MCALTVLLTFETFWQPKLDFYSKLDFYQKDQAHPWKTRHIVVRPLLMLSLASLVALSRLSLWCIRKVGRLLVWQLFAYSGEVTVVAPMFIQW